MKNRQTKILHVIGNLGGSGAERQLQLLVNNTDPNRYRISILFLYQGTDSHGFNETTELIQIPRGPKWNIFQLWHRIYRAVMDYRPDILHLWLPEIVTIPAAVAGKLSGAYILSAVRGTRRSVRSIKRRLRSSIRYMDYLIADRIVTNFNPSREPWFFRKLFSWKKGCIIRNAIVLDNISDTIVPATAIHKNASFMLWYTGRIIPSKCLDILLDSFIQLRKEGLDISLVICGTGHPKLVRQLKKTIQTSGMEDHIVLCGYRNDWHSLARNADLFVLPSTAEGMPNVLFEAMLLGIPCIVTDIPVIRDLVSHKIHVWMVQAGSQAHLSSGIREMYQSASLRMQLAQAGRLHANCFSLEKMVWAYNTLYESCTQSGAIPSGNNDVPQSMNLLTRPQCRLKENPQGKQK